MGTNLFDKGNLRPIILKRICRCMIHSKQQKEDIINLLGCFEMYCRNQMASEALY